MLSSLSTRALGPSPAFPAMPVKAQMIGGDSMTAQNLLLYFQRLAETIPQSLQTYNMHGN